MRDNVEATQEQFAVAAATLVEAYGDLKVRGYLSEPRRVAAAIADVRNMISDLADVGASGPYGGEEVIQLIEDARKHHLHTCSCPWCVHGTEAP